MERRIAPLAGARVSRKTNTAVTLVAYTDRDNAKRWTVNSVFTIDQCFRSTIVTGDSCPSAPGSWNLRHTTDHYTVDSQIWRLRTDIYDTLSRWHHLIAGVAFPPRTRSLSIDDNRQNGTWVSYVRPARHDSSHNAMYKTYIVRDRRNGSENVRNTIGWHVYVRPPRDSPCVSKWIAR